MKTLHEIIAEAKDAAPIRTKWRLTLEVTDTKSKERMGELFMRICEAAGAKYCECLLIEVEGESRI